MNASPGDNLSKTCDTLIETISESIKQLVLLLDMTTSLKKASIKLSKSGVQSVRSAGVLAASEEVVAGAIAIVFHLKYTVLRASSPLRDHQKQHRAV